MAIPQHFKETAKQGFELALVNNKGCAYRRFDDPKVSFTWHNECIAPKLVLKETNLTLQPGNSLCPTERFGACDEPINDDLRDHQLHKATDWQNHETISRLHFYFDLFNNQLFAPNVIPSAAISLEPTRRSRLGHYVPGRNGFGLCHNINLNAKWIGEITEIERLIVLAHEMIHAAQETYGKPSKASWYHNNEFVRMADRIGIIANQPRGHTIAVRDPFLALCRAHGVNDAVPEFTPTEGFRTKGTGRSTLAKWICRCLPPVNVWIGVSRFDATCNRCQEQFVPAAV